MKAGTPCKQHTALRQPAFAQSSGRTSASARAAQRPQYHTFVARHLTQQVATHTAAPVAICDTQSMRRQGLPRMSPFNSGLCYDSLSLALAVADRTKSSHYSIMVNNGFWRY